MNRVFVTGDTHGSQNYDLRKLNSKKFPEGNELTKDDYVIIAGDFGFIWDVNYSRDEELYWLDWLNKKPWTTLFVDGNHENFDRLDNLTITDKFGGNVGVVTDNIYHLKRGEYYNINGLDILTFGGGTSIDKIHRREFISWWSQEDPDFSEYDNCNSNLEDHDWKADVIITHDCSTRIYDLLDIEKYSESSFLQKFLDVLEDKVNFKHWFFGHYHQDYKVDGKHTLLYNSVKEITKEK